uniref:Putative secreted protein n=1 Tax=Anopheles triannulatus TaxID=58253 RepID=A0A2M4B5T9_9DIPT
MVVQSKYPFLGNTRARSLARSLALLFCPAAVCARSGRRRRRCPRRRWRSRRRWPATENPEAKRILRTHARTRRGSVL